MREPTYRDALRASWSLAWHHKNLWPFGLFAMLLGQFGLFELVAKVWGVLYVRGNPTMWEWYQAFASKESLAQLKVLFGIGADHWIWAVWLLIMLVGLAISLGFVATVTQGALVYAGAKFSKFRLKYPDEIKAWHVGVEHFWRVLTLNILRKFIVGLAGLEVVMTAARLALHPTLAMGLVVALGFAAAVSIGIIASFLLMYAIGYVVVEEYSVKESLRAAWKLFLKHPAVSLEVGLIVLFLNIGLLLFSMFAVLYVFALPIIAGSYIVVFFSLPLLGKIVGSVSYALFLAIMMTAGAVFTVYTTTLWSFLFSKMHSGNFVSKLVRLARR